MGKKKNAGMRLPRERLDQVANMLTSMVPYNIIAKQLSMQWGTKLRQVYNYITRVHEEWAEQSALTINLRRHQIRNAMEALYVQCMSKGDRRTAMRALRELGHLDGAYAPTRVDVAASGSVGVGLSLGGLGFQSPEDVKARIEELQAKIREAGAAAVKSNGAAVVTNVTVK